MVRRAFSIQAKYSPDIEPVAFFLQKKTQSSVLGGFNNQERDPELGDYYTFEFRVHDARIGRFLSTDRLQTIYLWNSTYAFAENDVISCIDLEGLERFYSPEGKLLGKNGTSTEIYVVTQGFIDAVIKGNNDLSSMITNPPNENTIRIIKNCSKRAYLNTEENRNEVFSNWATKNRNTEREKAMSLFVASVDNPDGKGDKISIFVEGSTAEGYKARADDPISWIPSVRPEDSEAPFTGQIWSRGATIHTHPSGDADDFSNYYSSLAVTGDLQWALEHDVDFYLVPLFGDEMGKFDVEKYKNAICLTIEKSNPTAKPKLQDAVFCRNCEGDPAAPYNQTEKDSAISRVKINSKPKSEVKK